MATAAKQCGPDIVERTVAYSIRIIKLYRAIEKDGVGRVIGRQLLRSATSVGANVHEAQAAQTKADFVAKLYIAYKEARESLYWLRLIREIGIVKAARLQPLSDETDQLVRILSAILLSLKKGKKLGSGQFITHNS